MSAALESEIAQQPRVIRRLLRDGSGDAAACAALLRRCAHLTLAARGSSDNAATYGKYLLESVAGVVTALAAPSLTTRYRTPPDFADGGVIGISQSGAAPDVASVLRGARALGAPTIAITNRSGSAVARAAVRSFPLGAGPERAIAATKTYTATCLALSLIASDLAPERGRDRLSFEGLAESVVEAVSLRAETERLATRLGRLTRLVVLGRGFEYATALEAALKIKELARIWAEPYASADFFHGPITLLEKGMPVLVVAARGATTADTRSTVAALRRRGARVFAMTDDPRLAEDSDDAVFLERSVATPLSAIPLTVVAQQLAVSLARRSGRDPDRPAGLAKVTRTR